MTHQELAIQFFENFVYESDDQSAQSIADFLKGRKDDIADRDTFIEQLATVIVAKHSGESYIDHGRSNNIGFKAQALLTVAEKPPISENVTKCLSDMTKEGERIGNRFNSMLEEYASWCGDKIFTVLEREDGDLHRLMQNLCDEAQDAFQENFDLNISGTSDDDLYFEMLQHITKRIETSATTPLRIDSDGKVFKVK